MAGLVFNMTDCPSEDDDEEHHPVYLPKVIVHTFTRGAENKFPGFSRKPGHFLTGRKRVPRKGTGNIMAISPVFQNLCDSGLTGL